MRLRPLVAAQYELLQRPTLGRDHEPARRPLIHHHVNAGFWAVRLARRRAAMGRVLPATSLARAAAVQRIAGIRYPVAVGSVRVWPEQSPRVDRARRGRR